MIVFQFLALKYNHGYTLWIADLNEALKEELQRLRAQNSRLTAVSGNPPFGGMFSQFASQLALQQQITNPPPPQQAQPGMPPPRPDQQPPLNGLGRPNIMDFNQRK